MQVSILPFPSTAESVTLPGPVVPAGLALPTSEAVQEDYCFLGVTRGICVLCSSSTTSPSVPRASTHAVWTRVAIDPPNPGPPCGVSMRGQ